MMSPLLLLALTRLLISDVSCVSLTQESTVMRSEKKQKTEVMELRASGAGAMQPETSSDVRDDAICREDFPVAPEGDCNCTEGHTRVTNEQECMDAASFSGASTFWYNFRLNAAWEHYHPQGCFKATCQEAPSGVCYYFNGMGDQPAKCSGIDLLIEPKQPALTGQAVCRRKTYDFGANNANDGCPAGYSNIMVEATCTEAAECLPKTIGVIPGGESNIVTVRNQSQFDDFPHGCFLNRASPNNSAHLEHAGITSNLQNEDKVFFNPTLENWELPKHPIGVPLCKVTTRTEWVGVATHSGINTTARAGAATTVAAPTTAPGLLQAAGKSSYVINAEQK